MKVHLKDARIEEIIERGQVLSKAEEQHIKNCRSCRAKIEKEEQLDNMLGHIKPQRAPADLYQKVYQKISASQKGFDWWFLLAALFLVLLSGYYIFATNPLIGEIAGIVGETLSPYAKDVLSIMPDFSFKGDLPVKLNLMLAGVLVVSLFILLDRFIARHYRRLH